MTEAQSAFPIPAEDQSWHAKRSLLRVYLCPRVTRLTTQNLKSKIHIFPTITQEEPQLTLWDVPFLPNCGTSVFRTRTSDLYCLDLEKALFNLIPSCSWIDGPMMPQVIKAEMPPINRHETEG